MRKIDKKTERLRFAFMAAAVLMAALLGGRVARSRVEPAWAQNVSARAAIGSPSDPNAVGPRLDALKRVAETLKDKNLFVKRPKKEHPVKAVDGILGDEILIGDKWHKVGDKIADANVVSIEATHVTIKWDGKEKKFSPIASGRSGPPSAPGRPTRLPKKIRKPEAPKVVARSEGAAVQMGEAPTEEDPLAWMGIDLPPKVRAKIMEMWNGASEEERAQGMEEWNRMSDSERQEAINEMNERM